MPRLVVPIESNPEVFSALAHKLGVSPLLEFHDVYSISEPDLLAMVPKPSYAVILLFPLTTAFEQRRKASDEQRPSYANEQSEAVFWTRQTIRNGCGLYALLHAALNLPEALLLYGSPVQRLSQLSQGATVAELTALVELMESQAYDELAQGGSTAAPDAEETVSLHFACFVKGKDSHVYELDGRRNGPVDLGVAEEGDVLEQVTVRDRIQSYMDAAGDEGKYEFSIMLLGGALD